MARASRTVEALIKWVKDSLPTEWVEFNKIVRACQGLPRFGVHAEKWRVAYALSVARRVGLAERKIKVVMENGGCPKWITFWRRKLE